MNLLFMKKPTFLSTSVFIITTSLALTSLAAENLAQETEKLLNEYNANPSAFMNKIPVKTAEFGQEVNSKNQFSNTKDFVSLKDKIRSKITSSEKQGRAQINNNNDNPASLVDNKDSMVTNLLTMDEKYKSAKLEVQPWSDTYWPLYSGNIAWRYGDSSFPNGSESEWLKVTEFYNKLIAVDLFSSDASKYDSLSPAEKYDLLVGDTNKSLTASALRSGQEIFNAYGKVEEWMGICHGWAPAAYNMPRPEKLITVTAADGKTRINFYPSDLKGLGSYLWANAKYRSKFIGGRCNEKEPKMDKRTNRVTDQDCFDTNPGTWHTVIVNQLAIAKRSFVFDATYDYEVWNQPVLSYEYTYFNPKTKKQTNDIKKATVKKGSVDSIRFKKFRSENVDSVVGVSMNVSYMIENSPSQRKEDSPRYDYITSVTYLYDLELDKDQNIIGGEWYENAHPDFIWTPEANFPEDTKENEGKPKYTKLKTRYDQRLDSQGATKWNPEANEALPKEWVVQAKAASSEAGLPLANIVDALVEYANKK